MQFGKAAAAARLQYIEEPVACTADLPAFYQRTGIPLALDESVDEGGGRPGGLLSPVKGSMYAEWERQPCVCVRFN